MFHLKLWLQVWYFNSLAIFPSSWFILGHQSRGKNYYRKRKQSVTYGKRFYHDQPFVFFIDHRPMLLCIANKYSENWNSLDHSREQRNLVLNMWNPAIGVLYYPQGSYENADNPSSLHWLTCATPAVFLSVICHCLPLNNANLGSIDFQIIIIIISLAFFILKTFVSTSGVRGLTMK